MFQNRSPHNLNYELVVQEGSRLRHWWYDHVARVWNRGALFGHDVAVGAVAFQNRKPDNYHYEVIAAETGGKLRHYWYGHEDDGQWHEGESFGSGCASRPTGFVNRAAANYNFEIVVREWNSLRHYWFDLLGDGRWHTGELFAVDLVAGIPTAFQNNSPGNFNYEVIIPQGEGGKNNLRHWYYNHLGDGQWHQAQAFGTNLHMPTAFQNHAPGNWNYEVVAHESVGGVNQLRHWYYNHLGDGLWHQAQAFACGNPLGATAMQEQSQDSHEYEVVVADNGRLRRYSYGHLTDGRWHAREAVGGVIVPSPRQPIPHTAPSAEANV